MPLSPQEFDFFLPEELIAQFPAEKRDASKLLVCDRFESSWNHSAISELSQHLLPGDLLVFNNTQVIPARLRGHLVENGKPIELLLLRDRGEEGWECLAKPARALKEGTEINLGEGSFRAVVLSLGEEGIRKIRFESQSGISFLDFLNLEGEVPLPPYIKRKPIESDSNRYQTVYANEKGAVAAPTAGLHFTPELLSQLEQNEIHLTFITLHVGLGTFRPLSEKQWNEGKLHNEAYAISTKAADKINKALKERRRIIAVGTTTVRALESAAKTSLPIKPTQEETDIFIYPPFNFKVVSGMITNFHLPNSSLLWLVSAFAKKEFIQELYQEAIRKEYRFYSYGDAMLIL